MSASQSNIILTRKEREQVLTDFKLQFLEVEPNVYQIINTDVQVDIEALQLALKRCALIISAKHTSRKLDTGYTHTISNIYYAIIGSDNRELFKQYFNEAHNKLGRAMLMCYKHTPNHTSSIDTIYEKGVN